MKKETKKETSLVNAEQLSLILNISEFTIKKLARSKELPCSHINGKIVFSIESVLARFKELEGGAA
jgi:hypothetical protein